MIVQKIGIKWNLGCSGGQHLKQTVTIPFLII
ncbi:hypothetical protein Bcop_0194 [Bacteroides coprosuis DSM 18011]|uniref:Uncharacterized protein n=1 Tax=Bacteroides coprosuis DSM 18011 TaxID=679937 RepID=F3ZPX1_9BACE|nr:hypothetical protein Bcop_0194 [Bacteroides coprosuis DSM 18011]